MEGFEFYILCTGGIGLLLAFIIKKFLTRNEDYWTKRNTPTMKVDGGALHNIYLLITKQKDPSEFYVDRYNALGDKPFGGSIDVGVPSLMLKDPDLIKQVLIKDFDYFVNRRKVHLEGEPIFNQMLINLEDQEWKDKRSLMSPTFTTGKIRGMFEIFNNSGKNLVEFIKSKPVGSPRSRDIVIKEFVTRYLTDVIASTAFGMEANTLKDPNSIFYRYAKQITEVTPLRFSKLVLLTVFPFLSRFGLRFFDQEPINFFGAILKKNIDGREASKDFCRKDFLQLLLETRKSKLKTDVDDEEEVEQVKITEKEKLTNEMSDEMILSQSLMFFMAGLDTTGALLSFAFYLLALNQDVQEKLHKEIHKSVDFNKSQIDYETINKMEYLDWVISEVLRMYPPSPTLERRCTRPYTIPGTSTTIEKDVIVWVPAIGLHRDPKYYPNPEKFDPERFSPEVKATRNPYTWLPFGQGPRNCIGMRFALMEAKVAIAYVISNYLIEPSEKTAIPLKVNSSVPGRPDSKLELRFKERHK